MANNAITNGQIKLGHVYHFRNKAYPKYALNVWSSSNYPQAKLSNVCLWEYDETDIAQKWVIKNSTPSYIQPLKGSSSNLYLDRYTGTGAGAGINAHLYTPSDTSLFDILTASQDSVKIKVADKNLYLTAYGGTNGKRTGKTDESEGNVFFAANSNSLAQEWIPVDDSFSGGETTGTPQKLVGPYVYTGVTNDYQCDVVTSKCGCYEYSFHYGTDLIGKQNDRETTDTTIKASGRGMVMSIRNSTSKALGRTILVKYDNVLNKNGVNIGDVYFRYCHLASIAVEEDEVVSADTVLGERGHSGSGCPDNQPHLHLEATTNPNATADNSQSENGGLTDLKKFDVRNVLYTKTSTTGIGKRECMVDHDSPFNSFINCKHGNAWYSLASFPSYD